MPPDYDSERVLAGDDEARASGFGPVTEESNRGVLTHQVRIADLVGRCFQGRDQMSGSDTGASRQRRAVGGLLRSYFERNQ